MKLSLIPVIALVGCTTVHERTVPVEVKVPVPVRCLRESDIPDPVTDASTVLRKTDTPGEKIKAVLIEREQLRQSDTTMRVMIRACTTQE